ncbi:2-hydroxyacid dehydrogenase [Tropicimonas sp.]|uniref:2-hydroxyacid dehydrogenase n=1 Tax=Tropicimonas sp. TaxID=2067044 RepID=UPI003A8ACEA1
MSTIAQNVLGIGPFSEAEAGGLVAELGAAVLPSPTALAALSAEERAGVAAVAYKGGAPFGADEMALLPNLGLIANFGVGYDAIDVAAAVARNIGVTNTPDVLNADVADLAVALTLAQFRRLAEGDAWVRSGRWENEAMPLCRKMSGTTVGILGLGNIGREIARRFEAFGMPVHYWSRREKETPGWTWHATPVELAGAVEILVVIVVGGPDTRHIVDAGVIGALGPAGVLVNVSRGSTVDEEALIAALENGRLGGAALDVFESEPRPDRRFAALPNVALYPHGASATHETRAAMARLQRANIDAYLTGAPLLTPVTS